MAYQNSKASKSKPSQVENYIGIPLTTEQQTAIQDLVGIFKHEEDAVGFLLNLGVASWKRIVREAGEPLLHDESESR